ncbi:GTPase activating protein (GAP) for Rho1p [Fusarium irregulare]|uniref:GTPase activating protein (GAP) for Rho1p n=1 Tax=Fusarium irregulare TaxID=2494466 RepID=A0A9W8PV50_9HYPO|nr:GTPase activating protein (GAP) for Rho1p [Fusarium irregulare]KAJ4026803.1 GTPase activating protein (GAP) for Rho1p [Fusarium irregulare]
MADPLSIAASVVGIVTAATQVSKILANVIEKARNAPKECSRILSVVSDIQNVLTTLQLYIMGARRAPRSRTSLIMVEQVVATLAACVTTFSELDTFAIALQNDAEMKVLDRLRWSSKDKEIKAVLVRLESHKSSLTLMLAILSWQEEAESRVDRLCDLVEEVLSRDTTLKKRLVAIEVRDEATMPKDTIDSRLDQLSVGDTPDVDTAPQSDPFPSNKPPEWQRNPYGFAFEEILMSSRAYRVASKDNSDAFSIISSAGRTASWSMLSGLSLSEVSHIGIQALPIYASDIANKECYDFSPTAANTIRIEDLQETDSLKLSRRDRLKGLFRIPRVPEPEPDHAALPPVFGVELQTSIRTANVAISRINDEGQSEIYGYIPIVVAKGGIFLKEKGVQVEDIFATAGNPVRMRQLQAAFDSPPRYGKGLDWVGYTVHDAAGILLRYLKSLPEPIIPYSFYNRFTSELTPFIDRELDHVETPRVLEIVRGLVMELPPLSRHLLVYIMDIIGVFAYWSESNNTTKLGLISTFQPSLISGPPDEMNAEAHHIAASVAMVLVQFEMEMSVMME